MSARILEQPSSTSATTSPKNSITQEQQVWIEWRQQIGVGSSGMALPICLRAAADGLSYVRVRGSLHPQAIEPGE
jgi:hypothetical protein